jgi:hypothetical protein
MIGFLGVDPGESGGIVLLTDDYVFSVSLSGKDNYDIRNQIESIKQLHPGMIYCCIERVSGFIGGEDGQGNKRNVASAHTTFILGESYGALDMALVCSRITRIHVLPKVWQKAMGCDKRDGESKSQHKNRIKKMVQKKHPEEKITLQTADAFMLAHYCKSLRW